MSAADRIYGLLLRAYPVQFRRRFGAEMLQLFRDQRSEQESLGPGFWLAVLGDVAGSAPAERLDAWRTNTNGDTQLEVGTMKTMAILSILIGAFEAVNAGMEGYLGGVVNGGGVSLLAGVAGIVAGALVAAAGVALLRRSENAASFSRAAALACLVVFAILAATHGPMSIFSTLLGIVFPIALLVYLRLNNGRGGPRQAAA